MVPAQPSGAEQVPEWVRTRRRPGPVWWCWYMLGGPLPPRFASWVLYDAACDTWLLRHFLRAGLQICLIGAPVVLLLPGPAWVRMAAGLLGLLVGLQYALWFMDGSVERRVRRAGYPPGAVEAARDELHAQERAAAAARYAARWRPTDPPRPH